jgi:hypothetical protein
MRMHRRGLQEYQSAYYLQAPDDSVRSSQGAVGEADTRKVKGRLWSVTDRSHAATPTEPVSRLTHGSSAVAGGSVNETSIVQPVLCIDTG